MTKQDPDKLCEECRKFDRSINGNVGACNDILVNCGHDEAMSEFISEYGGNLHYIDKDGNIRNAADDLNEREKNKLACLKTGCKHLETRCKDCGRLVSSIDHQFGFIPFKLKDILDVIDMLPISAFLEDKESCKKLLEQAHKAMELIDD